MHNRPTKQTLGRFGETAAAVELQRNGYQILARNWRCPVGEIDIVARHGHDLVFVEVRTVRSPGLMAPEESVTPAKAAKLQELAGTYLQLNPLPAGLSGWRVDFVAVEVGRDGRLRRVEIIPNAVEAPAG